MPGWLMKREFSAFLRTPLSVRKAMGVIVTATVGSVIVGGVLVHLLDRREFPDLGTGLWWALQTVTTVGYGDVVPRNGIGRVVGAVVMLEAIAFVAIVTAAITSSFVARARREQIGSVDTGLVGGSEVAGQLTEILTRLERIERALERDGAPGASRGSSS